jgi:hypothetical protein
MEETIESALDELRGMFPGKESTIEFSTKGTVLITVIDAVPFFKYQKRLTDCMNEVRAWARKRDAAAAEESK